LYLRGHRVRGVARRFLCCGNHRLSPLGKQPLLPGQAARFDCMGGSPHNITPCCRLFARGPITSFRCKHETAAVRPRNGLGPGTCAAAAYKRFEFHSATLVYTNCQFRSVRPHRQLSVLELHAPGRRDKHHTHDTKQYPGTRSAPRGPSRIARWEAFAI